MSDLRKFSKNIFEYISNDDITYELKAELCRLLIEKIYICKGRVEIYLYIPINEVKSKVKSNETKILDSLFDTTKSILGNEIKSIKNKLRSFSSELELLLRYGSTDSKGYIYISTRGSIEKYRKGRAWRTKINVIQKPCIYYKEEELV